MEKNKQQVDIKVRIFIFKIWVNFSAQKFERQAKVILSLFILAFFAKRLGTFNKL
jgi:hypothetical protein